LLRNGHINIGIIFTASKRYAGYQMAFNTFSMHPDERNIIYTEKGKYEDGYKSALKLLEKNTKLTALFADTDIKAFGAIEAFKEKGLSVPDDISVIGFDNISPDCEHFGLTSVDVPRYEMGKAAVAMVEKMILKKSLTSESQVFSGTVIERDSVKKLNR
jgi:LacI family transcriptional regulator